MALYGNNMVYSPDGVLMFRASDKRAEWYLSRNLAEIIKEDSEGRHIRLLFNPNGKGHENDDYYTEKRYNRCVVCGEDNEELLTKHHVVPYMYRKFFPDEYKNRSSHDVVLMCKMHHYEYETHAFKLKNLIAEEYGVVDLTESSNVYYDKELQFAKSVANALLKYVENIPEGRISEMKRDFIKYTGLEPTTENLEKILNLDIRYRNDINHGEVIVSKIVDIQAFVERWRQHFLDYAKPKYLSENWSVTRSIK